MQTPVGSAEYPEVVMPECQVPKLLKGQKALVTGASSGIGKAVAIALGQAGAEVAAAISNFGARSLPIQADVSQESQVRAMFTQMLTLPARLRVQIDSSCDPAGVTPASQMTLS